MCQGDQINTMKEEISKFKEEETKQEKELDIKIEDDGKLETELKILKLD